MTSVFLRKVLFTMNIEDIQAKILEFRDERDWKQFHTSKNLAASVCIEAAELLEHFQWRSDTTELTLEKKKAVADEIADVAIYLMLLANDLEVDLEQAILNKLEQNAEKYPVDKAKGSSKKYTEL